MARLLTVPSGWGTAYAPTIGELQTLAAALSGTNAAINQAAETFSVEYPSMQAVLSFIQGGGVYVDYCGWPMYYPVIVSTYPAQGEAGLFGSFLSAMGADQYYCDGFDTSQAGCMPSYPYDRGWLSKYDISNPYGLIVGKDGAMAACTSLIFNRNDNAYPMVAVRSTGGSGIYFYGAAGSNGAVDPNQFAQFILSVMSSSQGGTGTGGGTVQTLQQQCQSEGNVWYDNQCLTPAEYQCILNGGVWVNGVCQLPTAGVVPPAQTTGPNWPLVIGGGLVGVGLIVGLVALAAGGE